MRFVTKSLLALSIVLTFLVLLISLSARFQLLNSGFLIDRFQKDQVYDKIDNYLIKELESTFAEEGLTKAESGKIANLLKKDSLQNITEKNIVNILNYIHGKVENLNLFFPLEYIPPEVRLDLDLTSDQISVSKLISAYGQGGTPVGEEFFLQLRTIGNYLTISLIISAISIAIYVFLLYRLEQPGKRLTFIAWSFIASGVLTLILCLLINIQTNNIATDLTKPNHELVQIILGTFAPPVVYGITRLWIFAAVFAIAVGVVFLFIKKGGGVINLGSKMLKK